jgi:hypothetical protein
MNTIRRFASVFEVIVLIGVLFASPLPVQAEASILGFEELRAGAHSGSREQALMVNNQYAAWGITFNDTYAFDYSLQPGAIEGFTRPGTRTAIEQCYSVGASKACYKPIQMDFSVPQARVKVWVGSSSQGWQDARSVILRAFDAAGQEIDHAMAEDIFGSEVVPIRQVLEVSSTVAKISRVQLYQLYLDGRIAPTSGLAVDDIEFDVEPPWNWYIRGLGGYNFGAGTDIPVVGDYNGDGKDDVAVFRPSNGIWYVRGIGEFRYGESGDYLVVGDYNGDGVDDIAVYRPSNGTWYISTRGNFHFGEAGDIPVPGDYNGDGWDDIAVYRPSNGTWYISTRGDFVYGQSGDIPLPGDYNGDGADDLAVFRPSNGTWYISTRGDFVYGQNGDIPLPGDYNGDGWADIAVFRSDAGVWYIRGMDAYEFGSDGDIPVVGDYDGDGKDDIAIFRPDLATLSCTSQGVIESGADLWHANGWTGQGTKIAIFDEFNNYEKMQNAGELPLHIQRYGNVKTDPDNAEFGHGVPVAEIIHDMAPEAQLAFVTADSQPGTRDIDLIRKVVEDGYDVINFSSGAFFGTTAGDGRTEDVKVDWVKEMVNAEKNGVIIVFSAGNNSLSHWIGNYVDSGAGGWHSFHKSLIPSFDTYESSFINRLGERTIQAADPFDGGTWKKTDFHWVSPSLPKDWIWLDYSLRWNDWNATRDGNDSRVDYNIYLMGWNGKEWDYLPNVWKDDRWWYPYSTAPQVSPKIPPHERIQYWIERPGEYGIAIQRHKGSAIQILDLQNYQGPPLEFNVRERSLQDGATLPFVLGVGALDMRPGWHVIAPYSSWGPVLGQGGTLENPTHNQPFITGYAEVQVCSTRTFGGTSAAAPHVAGAAALVKSAFPWYSAQQIRDYLSTNARDEGPGGYDNAYGYGVLHLGAPPP